ncbi:tetratricopeptide repeat protein [Saccharopolyspora sp. NPDC002376]
MGALLDAMLALAVDATADTADLPSHPDEWTRAMAHLIRAFSNANTGGLDAMRPELVRAAEAFRRCGERWARSVAMSSLGYAELSLGDLDRAEVSLAESIRLRRELDPEQPAAMEEGWLAQVLHRKGNVAEARARLHELLEAHPTAAMHAQLTLGDLARHDGDLAAAERYYRAIELPKYEPFRAIRDCALGNLAVDTGDLPTARTQLTKPSPQPQQLSTCHWWRSQQWQWPAYATAKEQPSPPRKSSERPTPSAAHQTPPTPTQNPYAQPCLTPQPDPPTTEAETSTTPKHSPSSRRTSATPDRSVTLEVVNFSRN